MIIEPFLRGDIDVFLELAVSEGWQVDPWEFDFLLSNFPQGCLCVRDESSGKGIGFVTSLRHERSGWIGNLIVSPDYRGQGIGEALFFMALQILFETGADTCWLTASKQGQSLYEKYGFMAIDSIIRWTGTGHQQQTTHVQQSCNDLTGTSPGIIDSQAWGDQRNALLEAAIVRGTLLRQVSGFLVLQPCGESIQFGPFSALDNSSAVHLFDEAIQTIEPGTRICLDVPASNNMAMRLYKQRRMRISGTTELMYAGKKPNYQPKHLFSLATMGSCG